jgi:hypothetical protein
MTKYYSVIATALLVRLPKQKKLGVRSTNVHEYNSEALRDYEPPLPANEQVALEVTGERS